MKIRITLPAEILEASRALQAANRRWLEDRQADRWAYRNAARLVRHGLESVTSPISRAAGRRDPWRGAVPEFEERQLMFVRVRNEYIYSRTLYNITLTIIGDTINVLLNMETRLQYARLQGGNIEVKREATVYTGSVSLSLTGVVGAFYQPLLFGNFVSSSTPRKVISPPVSVGERFDGRTTFEVKLVSSYSVIDNTQAPLKYISPIPSVAIGIQGQSVWYTITSEFTTITGEQFATSQRSSETLNPTTATVGLPNSGTAWITNDAISNASSPPQPPLPPDAVLGFSETFSRQTALTSPPPLTINRQTQITIKEPGGNP